MSFKVILFLVSSLIFVGCDSDSKQIEEARNFIKNVPVGLFHNVHWKKTPSGEQLLYQVCENNAVKAIIDWNQNPEALYKWRRSYPVLDSLELKIEVLQKNPSWQVREVNGTVHCGQSLIFSLNNGDYIVKSKFNLDNTIGFKHSRTVLQEGWSYYRKNI